ncbi:MAG TPA: hypothetical protein VIM11_15045 [Tepidisphaeraceae bacterium]
MNSISRRQFSTGLFALGTVAAFSSFSPAEAPPSLDADLERIVTSGLNFLAKLQDNSGAFDAETQSSIWTTARALLAFLAAGNVPDLGKHGLVVHKSVDWLVAQQGSAGWFGPSDRGIRAHASATLALAEAYGVDPNADRRLTIHATLVHAVAVMIAGQVAGKTAAPSTGGGGWEGASPAARGENLSATATVLLALRACTDIGINLPPAVSRAATGFALRCYEGATGGFAPAPGKRADPRATAAGVVALFAADIASANTEKLDACSKYLASHVSEIVTPDGYAGMAPLAALRLGPDAWTSVGHPLLAKIAKAQEKDGGWPEVVLAGRNRLSRAAATASALAALTISYPLLPIYQRV